MIRNPSLLLVVMIVGCGGAGKSGVQSDKRLVDLNATEISDFCSYVVDVEMAPRTVDCGGGLTITLKNQADCISSFGQFMASCAATVSQGETCAEAVGANPCATENPACVPLLQCAGG
jgi:hypothetical protein